MNNESFEQISLNKNTWTGLLKEGKWNGEY
jgi:hypothetical protein